MTRPLRACLFGAGEMATTHAMTLLADPRVTLAHIVDPSTDRATALAAATAARVSDPDTAFADRDIDIFLIASPPRTHADYLDRAARTPAYVFCEKPIDHDIARIRACMAALKGRETRVQIGFNRRFDAQFGALKAAITAGQIGTPEQVLIVSRDAEAPEVEGFIHSSGLLKETAVHDFDLIRWLLDDEPAEVFVMADALINPQYLTVGQIDTTTTAIRMAKGTHVTVLNSLRAAYGYDQRVEVLGTLGQAAVGNVPQSQLILSTASGIRGETPLHNYHQRYAEAYRREITLFIDAVAAGAPVTPNAFDGLAASEVAEAALLSMHTRRPVLMEDWRAGRV
jgi:myo-inositol 2-dehydrogenase / D-chiro-inositol 1-dehydrogenase